MEVVEKYALPLDCRERLANMVVHMAGCWVGSSSFGAKIFLVVAFVATGGEP
jgi:hypothetical protein